MSDLDTKIGHYRELLRRLSHSEQKEFSFLFQLDANNTSAVYDMLKRMERYGGKGDTLGQIYQSLCSIRDALTG